MDRRSLLLALPALGLRPALAAPIPYALDATNSKVAFTFDVAGQDVRGTMPVASASIALDLADLAGSTVAATLDPTRARTGLLLATETMKGAGILDTERHPEIVFRSTRIRADRFIGEVDGDLTIRATTRPVTLAAQLYRQREATDNSRLTIHLSGQISRSAFGASAFSNFVADAVALDIVARVERAA